MKIHGNARTCPRSRSLIVRRVEQLGWTLAETAAAAGVSVRTVSKWLRAYRLEGELGLLDRSSEPGSIPHRTDEARVAAIAALRQLRMTAAEIAQCLAMPLSTVSAVLTRIGLGKRSRLGATRAARIATSVSARASSCTSTSRSSVASAGPDTASTVTAVPAHAGSAGSTCMSASMTPPAWPTSRCSRTRKPSPPPRSCAAP